MAKEKPFHTSTYRNGDVQKQQFYAAPVGSDVGSDAGSDSEAADERAVAHSTPVVAGGDWPADFVSRMTHDLMNALSVASSFGEMLLEDLPAGDPRHQQAEKALQGCVLAMRLVKMLRDPARWRNQSDSYLDIARAERDVEPRIERRVDAYASSYQAAQPPEEELSDDVDAAPTPPLPHESLRILVIDGRSAIADTLSHGFDLMGHKAFPVYDPQEALNLFYETSGEWDVVICPVILRGQGGAGLLQKIKAVDPRVLTVLSTGAPTPDAFSPAGCDLVVESAAGAQKISGILAAHMARAGRHPRVRVVA